MINDSDQVVPSAIVGSVKSVVDNTPGEVSEAQIPSSVVSADLDYICDNLRHEFGQMGGQKVLVTGGGGFLGYYLVLSVLRWNEVTEGPPISLTILDNFLRGVPRWLSEYNQETLAVVRKHDVTLGLPDDLEPHDYILHAASIASPTYYRKYPIETMDANVRGLRKLLEWSRENIALGNPTSGFLFFSSSEIYGDPDPAHIPTEESYRGFVSCTGPRACYDESKRYGETLCVNFARVYGLPITIARPFNNYGPGLKITDRRVLPDLARDILAGRDLRLLSDGSPTRTFCYVADAVIGYYKILTRGQTGEPYNIGTEEPEVTIRDIAEKLAQHAADLLGYRGRVVFTTSDEADYLTDNPRRRCPSIKKARQQLGYNPQVDLDEGLRRMLIWYASNQTGAEA